MKKKHVKQKKGQITSVITLFIIVLILGLTIVLGRYILSQFNTAFAEAVDADPNIDGTVAKQSVADMQSQYNTFDYAMVIVVIFLIMGMMVTSFMIPTHPIFLVVNVFGIFLLVFIGMIMSNIYGEIVAGDDATLTSTANDFSMINFILGYLPFIGAITILITSIIMYARNT